MLNHKKMQMADFLVNKYKSFVDSHEKEFRVGTI